MQDWIMDNLSLVQLALSSAFFCAKPWRICVLTLLGISRCLLQYLGYIVLWLWQFWDLKMYNQLLLWYQILTIIFWTLVSLDQTVIWQQMQNSQRDWLACVLLVPQEDSCYGNHVKPVLLEYETWCMSEYKITNPIFELGCDRANSSRLSQVGTNGEQNRNLVRIRGSTG